MMATLQREPTNVHDRYAVVVHLLGPKGGKEKAGYIAADKAPSWHGVLREVRKRKATAVARASVYRAGGGNYSVVLHLGAPWSAVLRNDPPEEAELLDADKEVVLEGAKDCQDLLVSYLDVLVWATLFRTVIPSGKDAGRVTFGVMVDGQYVGHFSPRRAAPYLDIIEEGDLVACEASVRKGWKLLEARVWMPDYDAL
ncbi:MAG: hypothetical protein Q3979_05425 [Actinomycetaceae bacterium]|nr:hypothetical protein [Actinomycetaceae bacterium]